MQMIPLQQGFCLGAKALPSTFKGLVRDKRITRWGAFRYRRCNFLCSMNNAGLACEQAAVELEQSDKGGSLARAHFYGRIGSVKGTNGASIRAPRPLIIGVAGGTASGKTSVCTTIIEGLKEHITEEQSILSISQDCFYKDLPPGVAAASYNFDHPSAFDFEEIEGTLLRLKSGNAVELPVYDYTTNARSNERSRISRANVILFDGILAFYSPVVRDLFDIKIFVDADPDTRLVRRIRRDICSRGRDINQVLDQYESTVKPSFESYILPTKKYADIIIPRGSENLVAIDLILKHVIMKLSVKS